MPSSENSQAKLASRLHAPHTQLRALAWLSTGVVALALAAGPVWSQTGSGGSGNSGSAAPRAGAATGNTAAVLSSEDRDMMEDLAEANIAEIETAQLALSKTQNPRVREFAQKMIDDHGMAQQELQQLAQAKGMTLPQETDLAHRTVSGALRLLSGETFESQYINRVGMDDHQRTIELLQKAQGQAREPELKALAGRMLPIVQAHLDMARQISAQREQRQDRQQGSSSGGSGGTTGSSSGGTSSGMGSGTR